MLMYDLACPHIEAPPHHPKYQQYPQNKIINNSIPSLLIPQKRLKTPTYKVMGSHRKILLLDGYQIIADTILSVKKSKIKMVLN